MRELVRGRHALRSTAVTAVAACCLAGCRASRPAPEPLGSANATGVTPPIGSCERDVDCMVLVGAACGPCGSCPGDAQRALSVAAMQQERDACQVEPAASGPSCSPCPAPPTDWIDRKAVCVTGSCSLEPPLGFQ